ncbi:tail fiber protein [Vibrio metschnikovii]|uniref:tail fiber protein n=1 Tax=Vibrio metschnikovii TaxID=28172 RepID=UPI0023DEC887|nr:tail fiber protein [Vibrio metschnikovii]
MEKLSHRVVVSDKQPLTTDIQYLESFTSSALNRKFSGMVHKGVFRGFECEALAGKHILVSSKGITGVALVERNDYVLTVRQNDDVLVDLGDIKDGYLILEAFYEYGVTTKQVDSKSKVDAALIKFVEVGKQEDHHTILCRVTIPAEAADVAAEHISYVERHYGGADIAQHVNTPDPHHQYVLREEKATDQEIDKRSKLLRHALLPQLWRALDNALRSVGISTDSDSAITSKGNALNGITLGIKTATLQRKGVVQLDSRYSSNSDELAATTAAVQRAVNHVIKTCLDKNATSVAALKLAKAFNLTLTGDATGNIDIDGEKNVNLNVTVKDNSHNHNIDNVKGLNDELAKKSDKTHQHDERYIRSFTLMDEDNQRKSISQGKFIRFASNPNISLKWSAGKGSESDPYVLQASVPNASVNAVGVSQLSSSTTSTDETKAATSKAVKDAKEQATTAATDNAKIYTDQQIESLAGGDAKYKSIKAVSDAAVSNAQGIAKINKALPTKANNSTKLKTSGAITGAGQIGDELTIGIQDATTEQKGAVQLSNSVSSDSQALASTPIATKTAHDRAVKAEKTAKAYADELFKQLLGNAPAEHLNTLRELGDALMDNDSDISAINAELAKKVDKAISIVASGALTGGGKLGSNVTLGIKDATTKEKGAVQLSSAVNSNSEALAATPKAVKVAYDKGLEALKKANELDESKITQAQGNTFYLGIDAKSKDSSKLNGATESETAVASSIAKRNNSGDLVARLFRSSYGNQTNISGALAFRINNGSDNYIRFCSSAPAVLAWLDAYSKKEANSLFLSNSGKTTLTENDSYGQASVTFNHKGGKPKQNGSAYRINAMVDAGTATLTIEMQNEAKANTELALKQVAVATTDIFDFKVELKELGQRVFSPNNLNISDSVTSANSKVYASSKAAKTAHDKAVEALKAANSKWAYKDATTKEKGAVQLSSAVNSTSETLAATPKAVKEAYDLAASKWTHRAASTTQTGTVQLTNAVNSDSQTLAASAKAVKAAYDKANHSHPYAAASHRHNFSQVDAGTSTGIFIASDFKGTSDRRLKTDIQPVGDMLGKLLELEIYEYEKDNHREIGVMAQDLQELIPTLVDANEEGYLSVSHFGLNACSIKAIQEQQVIIARQTQIIAEMAKRLGELEEKIYG